MKFNISMRNQFAITLIIFSGFLMLCQYAQDYTHKKNSDRAHFGYDIQQRKDLVYVVVHKKLPDRLKDLETGMSIKSANGVMDLYESK